MTCLTKASPQESPAGTPDPAYFQALNAPQRQAVETTEGPLLVLAGAGTGKTRVLTTRIAHLFETHKAWPSQVLAVTFTNKAALEMKERLATLLGREVEGMWLGTFHALCARILRRHAEQVGLQSTFTILDTEDQLRLLKQILRAENLDEKRWPPRVLSAVINRWKDRGLTPDKVTSSDLKGPQGDPTLRVYHLYQERLTTLNAVDFGDLMLKVLGLFQTVPEVLESYQTQFRYLLVDEYQDTNVAQYLWLRLLAQKHHNICCVGDDDQSIYGWRGAEVSNILRFEKDFAGATVVRLEENYRSPPHILGAASGLITHNEGRLGKTLWTQRDSGEQVLVRGVWDGQEEARFVGEEIETLHRQQEDLSTMAILVRASYQTREFEERFITLGVPYKVVGGARFYERQEIRDALAYLRLIAQPHDGLAFERIINVPRRGIGSATLQLLHHHARVEQVSFPTACQALVETEEIRGKARTSLQALLRSFERWRHQSAALKPSELAQIVLDESGYTGMWQQDKSPDAPTRLENLKELVRALGEFETLAGFLEHVSLVMDNNADNLSDKVSLMTMHSAKGLEFETVFLAGWEEEIFPSARSIKELGTKGLEEERRLAYVGLTRAKKRATITYASNRYLHGRWQSSAPSRFIDELPREHIHLVRPSRGYGGYDRRGRGGRESGRPWAFSSYQEASQTLNQTLKEGAPYPSSSPAVPLQASQASQGPNPSGAAYQVGDRVFHLKFGPGTVVSFLGDKLDIHFDKAGSKKVMASFVEALSK